MLRCANELGFAKKKFCSHGQVLFNIPRCFSSKSLQKALFKGVLFPRTGPLQNPSVFLFKISSKGPLQRSFVPTDRSSSTSLGVYIQHVNAMFSTFFHPESLLREDDLLRARILVPGFPIARSQQTLEMEQQTLLRKNTSWPAAYPFSSDLGDRYALHLCCNKVKLSSWKVSMIHANILPPLSPLPPPHFPPYVPPPSLSLPPPISPPPPFLHDSCMTHGTSA